MSQVVMRSLSATRSNECTTFETDLASLASPQPKSATTAPGPLKPHKQSPQPDIGLHRETNECVSSASATTASGPLQQCKLELSK